MFPPHVVLTTVFHLSNRNLNLTFMFHHKNSFRELYCYRTKEVTISLMYCPMHFKLTLIYVFLCSVKLYNSLNLFFMLEHKI